MGGALEGVTVIDVSRMVPGPYCSMILADHGARVIGIEERSYMADETFVYPVNRNKDHMTLNLKKKRDATYSLNFYLKPTCSSRAFGPV